jgi:hypothetical protein
VRAVHHVDDRALLLGGAEGHAVDVGHGGAETVDGAVGEVGVLIYTTIEGQLICSKNSVINGLS